MEYSLQGFFCDSTHILKGLELRVFFLSLFWSYSQLFFRVSLYRVRRCSFVAVVCDPAELSNFCINNAENLTKNTSIFGGFRALGNDQQAVYNSSRPWPCSWEVVGLVLQVARTGFGPLKALPRSSTCPLKGITFLPTLGCLKRGPP